MKYFLALFCIINSSFVFGMDGTDKSLDAITEKILMQYFKVDEKGILNENGINISTCENSHGITIYIHVDNDSNDPLAIILRENANKNSEISHTQCIATGDPEIVHESNQNYKNKKPEMRFFEVKAITKLTQYEFNKYKKQLIKK